MSGAIIDVAHKFYVEKD